MSIFLRYDFLIQSTYVARFQWHFCNSELFLFWLAENEELLKPPNNDPEFGLIKRLKIQMIWYKMKEFIWFLDLCLSIWFSLYDLLNHPDLRYCHEEVRILDCCNQTSQHLFPLVRHTFEDRFSDCSGMYRWKSQGQLRMVLLCC